MNNLIKNNFIKSSRLLSLIFYTLIFLILPLGISVLLSSAQFTKDYSNKFLDFKYNYFPSKNEISPDIIVLEFDNHSLEVLGDSPSFGRWPWKRNIYEPLLEYISLGSPKGILFDILFTEVSDNDYYLVKATRSIKNISHAFYFSNSSNSLPKDFSKYLSNFSMIEGNPLGAESFPVSGAFPFPDLLSASNHLHGVNFNSDHDGVIRQYNFAYTADNFTYPSLAWKALQFMNPIPNLNISDKKISYKLKERNVSVNNESGRTAIHYYSRSELNRLDRISASDVFYSILKTNSGKNLTQIEDNLILPEIFKDKIILLGATASGASDLHNSPYGELPGTVIQANVVSNWLKGDFRNDITEKNEFLFYTVIGLITILLFYFDFSIYKKVIFLALFLGFYVFSQWFFFTHNTHLPIFYGMYYFPIYLISFGLILMLEERKKRKATRQILDKYVARDVVIDALEKREIKAGVGLRREITVLFSDLRNFTSLSEELDPEEVVFILNRYLGRMSKSILKLKGTLDKFIGDAIMAFWNAPNENPKHAEAAVKAAIDMYGELNELNKSWKYKLHMGIGIHTGTAIAGNIGSDERLDYTAIGDTVNLASRLETKTKDFGADILVSDSTLKQLSFIDRIHYRYLGHIKVKGKRADISLYEIKAPFDENELMLFTKTKERFEKGVQLYFSNKLEEAIQIFKEINSESPLDKAIIYYLNRSELLLNNPKMTDEDLNQNL